MNEINTIISVFAFASSLVAIYLGFKNRRNVLREKIFEEQIKAATNIHAIVLEIENILDDLPIIDDPNEKETLLQKLSELRIEFHDVLGINALFLDSEIRKTINDSFSNINPTVKKAINGEEYNTSDYDDDFFEIEYSLQKLLGVYNLTKENRKLVK